jgi:hypothetical protein
MAELGRSMEETVPVQRRGIGEDGAVVRKPREVRNGPLKSHRSIYKAKQVERTMS